MDSKQGKVLVGKQTNTSASSWTFSRKQNKDTKKLTYLTVLATMCLENPVYEGKPKLR